MRHLCGRDPLFLRAVDDLVVDIGEIPHIGHVKTLAPEVPLDQVESHGPACMSEVGKIIHGHAAGIHGHLAGMDRDKFLFFPAQGIVKLYHRQTVLR